MSDADTIEVVDYDPNWALFFANEAERITGALKQFNLKSVQHIGGTAVVGLAAKPVIDILVEIGNPDETARVKTALIALGYAEKPPGPDADLLFCIKRAEDQRRTHHVHVVPTR